MAKKNEFNDETKYIGVLLEDVMGDRFGRYAKYIIQERALPDARDGLKPVQRRILYAMYHDGNTFDKPYRKSAKTVGLVIGNYHPHGDTSVYDAMVRMSQDWKVRLPLIDMHGNNGSIDDDPAAAMRYTEVRLAKVTQVMEDDLDKNTVEMAPNFDDTEKEPTVLPVPFPVMLVNGATGIAAGYATNMPPHNLSEVIDATIYRLQNPDCHPYEVLEYIPGPDFPTGGIVQGSSGIKEAFETGQGKIVIRAKAEIQEEKTVRQIVITEIPYEVVKSELVKKMDDIRLDKEIDGVLAVRDESDRTGLRIVVDVRKDADAEMILNYFYKNTKLQVSYNYNNVAIINKQPVQVGILGLIDAFLDFRKEVVLKRAHYELDKMETSCHVIEGLMKAISVMDRVIEIIRGSKNKADAKKNLIAEFAFDEIQAEAIVMLQLYRLSNTDIVKLRTEFAELVNKIEETKAIIENPKVLNYVITRELKEVKEEYGEPRRTRLEDEISELVIDKSSMVASETVIVTVSKDGYVKRVPLRSFTASDVSAVGIKEGDQMLGYKECDTLDTLLLFTSKGNYAYLPVWQIEEFKWKDLGMHLNKVVRIDGDDKIVDAALIHSFHTYAWIVSISSDGFIKKTPVSAWQVQRNGKVMTAMSLRPHTAMVRAFIAYENSTITLVTKNGYACSYGIEQIPEVGLRTKGVKAINLSEGDQLTGACAYTNEQHAVYATKEGLLKRIRMNDLPLGNRPFKGILIAKKVKSNPNVLRFVYPVSTSDILAFYDPEEKLIKAADIPLKTVDTTFSNPLSLRKGWYLRQGIQDCMACHVPEQTESEEKAHEDVEKISLFQTEENE